MTVSQPKRSVDRRFDRSDRRFDRLDRRTKANTSGLRRLRDEVRRSAEETRRHFDVIAESLRDGIRILAESLGVYTPRVDDHGVRIARLEQRVF